MGSSLARTGTGADTLLERQTCCSDSVRVGDMCSQLCTHAASFSRSGVPTWVETDLLDMYWVPYMLNRTVSMDSFVQSVEYSWQDWFGPVGFAAERQRLQIPQYDTLRKSFGVASAVYLVSECIGTQ